MEGLIIAIAELLLLPFIIGIAALCELALSLAWLVLQLLLVRKQIACPFANASPSVFKIQCRID